MAVPLIDLGVIKKGSLSPCLTKDSTEPSRAARWGNAASGPLQSPAFPVRFSMQKSHKVLCKPASRGTQGMCKLQYSAAFPFTNPSRHSSLLCGYETPSHWRSCLVQQRIFLEEESLLFWNWVFAALQGVKNTVATTEFGYFYVLI